ncbi:MAG: DUF1178 family protein [Acidovorax sp.]|nr:DUF1178 family protein [Acidovorax sp.]
MKVLDLHCPGGHAFEGWFASEGDFQAQLGRSLVQCPLCGSHEIRKALSAPRLNLGAQPASPPDAPLPKAPAHGDRAAQAAWLRMARKIMAETEDVGPRFAQEARRMHHGEIAERAIRGRSSVKETLQLLEEGIAVLPLPLPEAAKETLQ